MSTFHWFPLVNGYSGVYPPSYLARLERLRGFPDERSLAQLRLDQVRYVMLHVRGYPPDDFAALRLRLQQSDKFAELGSYNDADAPAVLSRSSTSGTALLCSGRRLIVSNRTCAILTVMAGAAFGAWWLATQRVMEASAARRPTRDHGTVIFDNHVPASDVADALV